MIDSIRENFIYDREQILRRVLGDELFNEMKKFFESIYHMAEEQGVSKCLVVCMARRSWVLCQMFAPLVGNYGSLSMTDGIDLPENIIHDRMLSAWFSYHSEANLESVYIVDDTLLYGTGIRNCIRRLSDNFSIKRSLIRIKVFRARIGNNEHKWYDKEGKFVFEQGEASIPCECGMYNRVYKEEVVRNCSTLFVKAIHAVGMPYVAYIPAFIFRLNDKVLNELQRYETDEAWSKRDISLSEHMKIGGEREAFSLFPPTDAKLSARPSEDVELVTALRFYVDKDKKLVTFVPYSAIQAVLIEQDIRCDFPEPLRIASKLLVDYDIHQDKGWEGQQQTYRILKYVSSFLIGRDFMEQYLHLSKDEYEVISCGGMHYAKDLFQILINDAPWNWSDIWNVVRKNQLQEELYTERPELDARFALELDIEKDICQVNQKVCKESALFNYFIRVYHKISRYAFHKGLPSYGIQIDRLYEKSKNVILKIADRFDYYAAILRLGDYGGVITHVSTCVRNGEVVAVGTSAVSGEASVNSIAVIYPELAWAMEKIREFDLLNEDDIGTLSKIIVRYIDSNHEGEASCFGSYTQRIIERFFTLLKNDRESAVSPDLILPREQPSEAAVFFTNLVYWYEGYQYDVLEEQERSIVSFREYIEEENKTAMASDYKTCGEEIRKLLDEGRYDRDEL
jgi:hypothetical protein